MYDRKSAEQLAHDLVVALPHIPMATRAATMLTEAVAEIAHLEEQCRTNARAIAELQRLTPRNGSRIFE